MTIILTPSFIFIFHQNQIRSRQFDKICPECVQHLTRAHENSPDMSDVSKMSEMSKNFLSEEKEISWLWWPRAWAGNYEVASSFPLSFRLPPLFRPRFRHSSAHPLEYHSRPRRKLVSETFSQLLLTPASALAVLLPCWPGLVVVVATLLEGEAGGHASCKSGYPGWK